MEIDETGERPMRGKDSESACGSEPCNKQRNSRIFDDFWLFAKCMCSDDEFASTHIALHICVKCM